MTDAGHESKSSTGDEPSTPVEETFAADAGTTDAGTTDAGGASSPPGGDAEQAAADKETTEDAMTLDQMLGDDLTRLAAERDEYLDSLRRLQADFDNFRKRALRQQTETLERAGESLLVQLLPVVDALDLAEAHAPEAASAPDKPGQSSALAQIGTLLRGTLEREGLERIDEVGVSFDPTIHDAVAHEEADDTTSGGSGAESESDREAGREASGPTVSEVMRAGYRLKGRVVRPAMVKVRG